MRYLCYVVAQTCGSCFVCCVLAESRLVDGSSSSSSCSYSMLLHRGVVVVVVVVFIFCLLCFAESRRMSTLVDV